MSESISEAEQITAIKIEKRLCGALGRQWAPSGMSVETLANDAANEIERLWAVNDTLCSLVRDTPIVVIDESNADVRGETSLVWYARAIRTWRARAKATLGGECGKSDGDQQKLVEG